MPGPSSALDRLLKLRGTAISSDKGLSCAIVELLQTGESRTVRIGEEVAGAKVIEISENSMLVSMENEEVRLQLDATEEYGGQARKSSRGGRGQGATGRSARNRGAGGTEIPPVVQEMLKRLSPEAQKEARRKWEAASPEDRKKYIKKVMEARQQGGGNAPGQLRNRRNPGRQR